MSEDVFRVVVAVGVTLAGIAFIVQTLLLFGMYRAAKTVNEKVSSLSDRAEPVLDNARKMLEENRPKLTQITDQTLEVVTTAKLQAQRLDALLTETSDRARAQMERIDFLLEDTVGRVQETTAALQATILRPVREVHGVVSGVRAALTALARGSRPSVDHVTQDEEMFI